MDSLHEPLQFVRPKWKQRDVHDADALPYLFEERSVRRIAGEVDTACSTRDDKAAPQRAIAIEQRAR